MAYISGKYTFKDTLTEYDGVGEWNWGNRYRYLIPVTHSFPNITTGAGSPSDPNWQLMIAKQGTIEFSFNTARMKDTINGSTAYMYRWIGSSLGWSSNLNANPKDGAYKVIDFGDTPQEIDDSVYNWLMKNVVVQDVTPVYLRINGVWVKQNGFIRESGNWKQISFA